MIAALPSMLLPLMVTALAKNVQGSRPAYAKIGYGIPSDGTLASRPKMTVNSNIVSSG